MGWWWLAGLAFGGCDAESASTTIEAAEQAYRGLDFEAFGVQATALEESVGCLEELASPRLAAQVHWVRALAAWIPRDQEALNRRLRAMVAADRFYEPDPSMVPEGSQLRFALDQARSWKPDATFPLPDGSWTLDGYGGASALPSGRSALVQLEDDAVKTWLIEDTSAPLPEVLIRPEPPPGLGGGSLTGAGIDTPRTSKTLLVAGGAAVVAGAAGLVVAALARAAYLEEPDEEAATGLQTANTAAGAAGISLLVVGGGLGATAVIAGRW